MLDEVIERLYGVKYAPDLWAHARATDSVHTYHRRASDPEPTREPFMKVRLNAMRCDACGHRLDDMGGCDSCAADLEAFGWGDDPDDGGLR